MSRLFDKDKREEMKQRRRQAIRNIIDSVSNGLGKGAITALLSSPLGVLIIIAAVAALLFFSFRS